MRDIRKDWSGTAPHSLTPEDLEAIHRLSPTEPKEEELYTFAVRLCDNEIDRDWERFDRSALEKLCSLFVGVTGIFDHQWSAKGQTARIYRTELCFEPSCVTAAGDPYCYVKGYAYMLRTEKNAELIAEIEAGIKKEVSVGCSMGRCVCSVCGRDWQKGGCQHRKGHSYQGKRCFAILQEPTDAYEWSFVAVPAQRKAGVIKHFGGYSPCELQKFIAQSGDAQLSEAFEETETLAQLGREYLAGLRKEVKRLAVLCGDEMEGWDSILARMDATELLDCQKTYQGRMEKLFPIAPQCRHIERTPSGTETELFCV